MVDPSIHNRIKGSLEEIAASNGITVLLAVESGSRAWGFASADSDYDVRFIYARPAGDYLRVSELRDVIELPIAEDLDVNGWDVRKAVGLLLKSNPTVIEWLGSPIVYAQLPAADVLRGAGKSFFDPAGASHHYLSMAEKNYRAFPPDSVADKKYLYVLRPLLCVEWIVSNRTAPPMLFSDLIDFSLGGKDADVLGSIERLLLRKQSGKEKDVQPRDSALDAFIERRLAHFKETDFGKSKPYDYALADNTFRGIIRGFAE